jgi:hypothetical protein
MIDPVIQVAVSIPKPHGGRRFEFQKRNGCYVELYGI